MNGEYFYQRALGGAGFICAGGAFIEPQGTPMRETPQINTHEHMLAWKKVVDKVHTVPGSVFFCQLWHCRGPPIPNQAKSTSQSQLTSDTTQVAV